MNCVAEAMLAFFFLRNGVSKDFFFFPGADKGDGKNLFEFLRGENRRTKPEALLLPRLYSRARDREHPGKGRALPASAPRGRTDSPFGQMPAPSSSPASCGQVDPTDPAGMLAARAPGRLSRAPNGARARRSLFIPLGARGAPSLQAALGGPAAGDGELGLPLRAGPGCCRSGVQPSFSSTRGLRLASWILGFCMCSDCSYICI